MNFIIHLYNIKSILQSNIYSPYHIIIFYPFLVINVHKYDICYRMSPHISTFIHT